MLYVRQTIQLPNTAAMEMPPGRRRRRRRPAPVRPAIVIVLLTHFVVPLTGWAQLLIDTDMSIDVDVRDALEPPTCHTGWTHKLCKHVARCLN